MSEKNGMSRKKNSTLVDEGDKAAREYVDSVSASKEYKTFVIDEMRRVQPMLQKFVMGLATDIGARGGLAVETAIKSAISLGISIGLAARNAELNADVCKQQAKEDGDR